MSAQRPHETVVLADERAALVAEFVPSAGMLCCSLRADGQELLAQNAGVEAYATRGKTMGIPLLYPWANRLAAFDYEVAGHSVAVPHDSGVVAVDGNGLPIHGVVAGRMAWELLDVSASDGLEARLRWSAAALGEAFAAFPFEHEVAYRARLHDARLEIEVAVSASGADRVPVSFGFHPYLALPGGGRERWRVQLPAMRRLVLDERQIPARHERSEDSTRDFQLGSLDFDDGFDSLADGAAFAVSDGDARLGLAFLGGYRFAQVYAPPRRQFICFEPMTAPANALRSGDGLTVLEPGQSASARFAVDVETSAPG